MADVTVCPLFSLLLLKDRGFLEIETFHQKGELDSRDSHVKRKVTHAERQDLKQHVQDKWDCMASLRQRKEILCGETEYG